MSQSHATSVIQYTLALVLLGVGTVIPLHTEAATPQSVTIQWAANTEPDLAGYQVYQGTTPGSYGYPTNVGNTTTYSIAKLQPLQTYYFAITAYDVNGNESHPSSEVNTNNLSSGQTGDSDGDQDGNASSSIISNLTVASGRSYVVPASGLQAGGIVYIDRTFTFTTVPANVQGATYIQTANADKAATTANFLQFAVSKPVTVYVAHDVRITPKPSWLSTFTDTGKDLVTSDTTLRLFAKAFPAGTITLGGNASGGGFSMYTVIVQPQEEDLPPAVALTGPADGTSVSGTISVSATATDDIGVAGVQFRLNGFNLGTEDTTSPFSRTWDTSGVTPGAYTLTAIARDAAGNTTSSAPVTVTVLDITPPSISITSPTNDITLSETVNIQVTATDDVGVVGVTFRLNGNTIGEEDTIAPFSASWDTTTVANGSYTLTATARDAAGNTITTSITVMVFNTKTLPSNSFSISNLTVASGWSYVMPAAGLKAGGMVYIDRPFTFTTVPANVQGATYIQTANADKAATTANFLQFTVSHPVTIYVAHDVRITSKPSWLSTFIDTGKDLVTSDATLRLFAKAFPAGTITLGGNASGGGFSMYTVILQPQDLGDSSLSISNLTVASGRSYVVPAAGLQAGDTVYTDRTFTFTTVPANVQGATYIQTANADKAATTANFLQFAVSHPVTVYVGHDVRITPKPSWLSTFTDTGKDLVTSDATLRLFAKAFPAGTITLGANTSGGGYSMYAVIIQP